MKKRIILIFAKINTIIDIDYSKLYDIKALSKTIH